jgi:hypothetical protein
MSFDLAVLAMTGDADTDSALAMFSTGIDHVIMHLSFSERSTPAIEAIMELAETHNLVLFDPQSNDAHFPHRSEG